MYPSYGLPGVRSDRTYAERVVRLTGEHRRYIPAGKIIDGSESRDPDHTGFKQVLRPGLLMGKISANGLYAPSIIGVTTTAYTAASTGTALVVTTQAAIEIVRRIGATGTLSITGPATAGGTVNTETKAYTAVDTETGIITLATDLTNNYIAGSFVGAADGSQTPLCLIDDNDFAEVVDRDDNDIDVPFARPLTGGQLKSSQIINWPSDTALRAWIVSKLNATGVGFFDFDHLF